ncbi:MAG: DUF4340 domain-containing protein, partial [Candidatus Latescibacterota bacterium]
RIEKADTAWTYRLKNGNWHYPANENAFALNERIKSFLKEIVESYGTVVATHPSPQFGFEENPLTVHLADSTGTWKQTVQIGASLPGEDTREAYMKIPQSDTIYHIHADPVRGMAWERLANHPPFIDHKVLPSALARRAIKKVVFANTAYPIQALERVEIETDKDKKTPAEGPTYEWYATQSNKRRQVVNGSVYAYLSFLGRLKYEALSDPSKMSQTNTYLVLIDDQDTADTLEVGLGQKSHIDLKHKTTGHLYTITPSKANLLFPSPALLDTLPNPSPYQIAEPTGPFSLASP